MHLTLNENKTKKTKQMETTLDELPTEILHDYLFQYLHDTDIYNLSQTGSSRLKEVSENFIQLGKYLRIRLKIIRI